MMAKEFEQVKLEEGTVRRAGCWLNGTGRWMQRFPSSNRSLEFNG